MDVITHDFATVDPLIVYDSAFGGFREFNLKISRNSLRRQIRAGSWPPPCRWSANRLGWFKSTLATHLASCVATERPNDRMSSSVATANAAQTP